jgi:NAD(P)-dependent dehydrogenase (short-subunit alcohol dehydrogenase family)
MRELAGKTAFVTGGASGIGLALGRAFAQAGMKVMLADIETGALAAALESLDGIGPDTRGVACDVADPVSVEDAAKAAYAAFGNVHVVCNNAGVASPGGLDDLSLESWQWVLDVNMLGVFHGIRSFVPHIRARRRRSHRQHRVDRRHAERVRIQLLRGQQVRGGGDVGRIGQTA